MYFAIAYDLWPHLTGRAMLSVKLMRVSCGCGSSA